MQSIDSLFFVHFVIHSFIYIYYISVSFFFHYIITDNENKTKRKNVYECLMIKIFTRNEFAQISFPGMMGHECMMLRCFPARSIFDVRLWLEGFHGS
jgi:hypothetical protein